MNATDRPLFAHAGFFGTGYRSDDGDVFIGTHGIVHQLTPQGFRLPISKPWGSNPAAVRVLALGCSYVFGYGLDERATWPAKFGALLDRTFGVECEVLNLGVPGASNDYILRQVVEGLEQSEPHILLVGFTQKERREYWETFTTYYTVRPGSPPNSRWSERRIEIQSALELLAKRANDFNRLYQSVKIVSALCRLSNTLLLYTYASVRETPATSQWLPPDGYLGIPFPMLDYAADGRHPGQRSNEFLALKTLTYLCTRLRTDGPAIDRLALHLGLKREASECAPESRTGDLDSYRSPI